jgi:hypothetical protein
VSCLDAACHQSSDPPDAPALVIATRKPNGRRGRPRIHIDPQFLSQALDLRGPSHLGHIFQCHPRTVRRRALECGIATPGEPVYHDHTLDDSTVTRTYTSSSRPVSTLSDEQLDHFVADILEVFPSFGQRMLSGRLKASGHHVPRDRIAASYLRVHGSPGIFGTRTIHRKVYKVAGANSLAHHDGQHGVHLLSNLGLSLTSHFYRTYPFQNCHTLLHRRQVSFCHWHSCQ